MSIFEDKTIDEIRNIIENNKKISVVGHKNTDPDCLGSAMALKYFFANKGIDVQIIIPNEIAEYLNWIFEDTKIWIYKTEKQECDKILEESDLIFIVDLSSYNRIDKVEKKLKELDTLKINIDHHRNPENLANYNFVDFHRASAAELVYEFLRKLDKNCIDKNVAESIYLGMISDNGNFKYPNVNTESFKIAAELLAYNIDRTRIVNNLYNNYSYNRLRLLGHLLKERMVFMPENRAAYLYLSLDDQKDFSYKLGDYKDFVNFPLTIAEVDFSMMIIEETDLIKISLRSLGDFDVNKIARKFFNGGGHKNAAGGRLRRSMDKTLEFINSNFDKIMETGKKGKN